MTDDSRFICRYGFHHVVVTLAAECSGVTHGITDETVQRAGDGDTMPDRSTDATE